MGLAAGDIISITYESSYDAQQIRYVLHYKTTTSGTSANPESDLLAIATNFVDPVNNSLIAAIQAAAVDQFFFEACTAQRVYPARTIGMRVTTSFPGAVVGTGLPANSAVVITKRTLTPGRAGIGSLHLSGVSTSWVQASEVAVANLPSFDTIGNEMLSSRTVTAVSVSMEPGLFNPTFPPNFFSRLFDCPAKTSIRVMRRRTVRVGI